MNDFTKEPCKRCGLIQLKDVLWGLKICDSKEAQIYGCPPRTYISTNYPEWIYDEQIYANRIEKPNFMDLLK